MCSHRGAQCLIRFFGCRLRLRFLQSLCPENEIWRRILTKVHTVYIVPTGCVVGSLGNYYSLIAGRCHDE